MAELRNAKVAQMEREEEPAAWSARICAVGELPRDEQSTVFELDGRRIAVFRVDGSFYAVDDYCTHAQSSLSIDGTRCGLVLECALHQAEFSLETGQALRGPTRKAIRRYDLQVGDADVVAVELPRAPIRRGI